MFDVAGLNPTVINGGIINAYGTNARVGSGAWMVVEADESDGTFTRIPATIAIVTNIDPEHLDFYGSFDAVRAAFQHFIENLPFYGFAVCCIDHPEVQALISRVHDRRIISYGLSPQADLRAVNIRTSKDGQQYDVEIGERLSGEPRSIQNVWLPMHGEHNLRNSLAVIAVALELDVPDKVIASAFENFSGVKRRFTKTGEVNGVTVIDDYGHHPVEIAATLKAARSAADTGRVIAVVQPHRYSRLHDLFDGFCTCFNDADIVVVTDIYSAGEAPIDGVSQESLVAGLRAAGHKHVVALEGGEAGLAPLVKSLAVSGDMVVCLGAGSISKWANALPEALEKLS
jgi:UDP-N-acetylmuramate--alanine ligase